MKTSTTIEKTKRNFLSSKFRLLTWINLRPYLDELKNRKLNSKEDLELWLKDISEVEAAVNEDACWRQIRMTCDTTDKNLEEEYTYFCMEIEPKIKPYFFENILEELLTKSLAY